MTRAHGQRWLAAALCVAIVVVAFAPGAAAVELVLFERPWVLLPDMSRATPVAAPPSQHLPHAPCSALLPARAPPASAIS